MNSALGIYPDNVPRGRSPFLLPQRVEIPSNGFTVACSSEKRARANHVGLLTPFALRPMEARVTAQADDVLGSDLFNLLLPYIRPDPFEPCFRPALSANAHGSPSRCDSAGLVENLRALR